MAKIYDTGDIELTYTSDAVISMEEMRKELEL